MQQFSVRFVLLCCCRMWRLWWTTERIFYNISSRAFWRIDHRRPFASGRRICWEEILLLLWIGCWWVELVISLNKFALCISPVLFLITCLFANTLLWQARRRQRNEGQFWTKCCILKAVKWIFFGTLLEKLLRQEQIGCYMLVLLREQSLNFRVSSS